MSGINPDYKRKNNSVPPVDELKEGILSGDAVLLSKAITMVESTLSAHQKLGRELVEHVLGHSGNSIRYGITGIPGSGKSTLIEAAGIKMIEQGHKVAVLAIDPSSPRSGGSILGDKTRMEQLSIHPKAYIRPTPSSGTLGGVARKTRECIVLLEAAGYDRIFIETVGVGQSETAVYSMVDFFLLVLIAGAGDELQGIKRGVMEMADAIVINKAEGDMLKQAKIAQAEYQAALHLFPASETNWHPSVVLASALHNTGLDDIFDLFNKHHRLLTSNGWFSKNRQRQSLFWMKETIESSILENFYSNTHVEGLRKEIEKKVVAGELDSYKAAEILLSEFKKQKEI